LVQAAVAKQLVGIPCGEGSRVYVDAIKHLVEVLNLLNGAVAEFVADVHRLLDLRTVVVDDVEALATGSFENLLNSAADLCLEMANEFIAPLGEDLVSARQLKGLADALRVHHLAGIPHARRG
jgi:hypothetical protein